MRLKKQLQTMEIEGGEKTVTLRGAYNDPSFEGEKKRRKIQKKRLVRGQKGDSDRSIFVKKPKHLFAGKMGNGTSNKR